VSIRPLGAGQKFRVQNPDGSIEWLTAKEYLARRGRFNIAHPLAEDPSPDAGSRRHWNPRGLPVRRGAPTGRSRR
jgi:hypothetical protein